MNPIKLLLVCCSSFVLCNSSFGQDDPAAECPAPEDQEAVKLFEKSRDKKKYEYDERVKFLLKAYDLAPDYAPVAYELGLHFQRKADETEASCEKCIEFFKIVVKNCPKYHSNAYFFLGKFYFDSEQYDTAVKYMKQFLDFKEDNPKKYDKLRYDRFLVDAKRYIAWARFYKEMFGHPVPYDPKLVEGLSTVRDEYLPFITPDNEVAFFTRALPVSSKNVVYQVAGDRELFCYAERQPNGKFEEGKPMPSPPFNTHPNEGGASVTIDNKHIFFTVNDMGNFDIWTSDIVNGDWGPVRTLGKNINSADFWDSQPSISADGKTLYFASNRPGGYGGVDIWKAEKDAYGNWQVPVNLGPNINTEGDEKSPFLHWDSRTLYFASGDNESGYSGHMNVGGFDIFYARMDSLGRWMKPRNIGYPINTEGDDLGFMVSSDGRYGFFASDNPKKTLGKSVGGKDIYYFELPANARPDEVAILKGKVTDESGNAVAGANVEIKDALTKKVTKAVVDSASGEYAVAANIQKRSELVLTIKKDNYAFSSQLISGKEIAQQKEEAAKTPAAKNNPIAAQAVVKVDMQTDSLQVNKSFKLNSIFFSLNKADLEDRSKLVLDEFVEYLKNNPSVAIQIQGHTDNVGNPTDNQNLSADRAFTVLEYLREKGVSKEQIKGYKGFGATQPVASNDTEEGRAKNRRTEFLIVSK